LKRHFIISAALMSAFALSGCMGSAGGLVGSAVAGSVATGAVASGPNKARFSRMDCAQLQAEINGAKRGMINPLTIPSTQAYINDAKTVAAAKNCVIT
jgi:hypothetical protein